jgi:hypothetical protein
MPGTLRERTIEKLVEAFGDPQVLPTPDGKLYRWVFKASGGDTIRLTLDSPEFNDLAHLVISDPKSVPRVTSVTMRMEDEVDAVIRSVTERLGR